MQKCIHFLCLCVGAGVDVHVCAVHPHCLQLTLCKSHSGNCGWHRGVALSAPMEAADLGMTFSPSGGHFCLNNRLFVIPLCPTPSVYQTHHQPMSNQPITCWKIFKIAWKKSAHPAKIFFYDYLYIFFYQHFLLYFWICLGLFYHLPPWPDDGNVSLSLRIA